MTTYIDMQDGRLNIHRQVQRTFVYELESRGMVTLDRWTYFAQKVSRYHMLEALLTANIRGYGKLLLIPDHLYDANIKHGPVGLLTLIGVYGYVPSKELINQVLVEESWIKHRPISYKKLVKSIYGSNSIMIRKWNRYAEGVRSL